VTVVQPLEQRRVAAAIDNRLALVNNKLSCHSPLIF
jgi:hypothetical protein